MWKWTCRARRDVTTPRHLEPLLWAQPGLGLVYLISRQKKEKREREREREEFCRELGYQ
jgi:hypothetical protein